MSIEEENNFHYVKLKHNDPVTSEEPPDKNGKFAIKSIDNINCWRLQFSNTNVFRSLLVTKNPQHQDGLLGPFVLDIDNEQENISDALDVTRKAYSYLTDILKINQDAVRVLFTGHKGFSIEVVPQELKIIGSTEEQIKLSRDITIEIIDYLRGNNHWPTLNQVSKRLTVIDRVYGSKREYCLCLPYIRLHDSVNAWITSKNTIYRRVKFILSRHEIDKLSSKEIIEKSESKLSC